MIESFVSVVVSVFLGFLFGGVPRFVQFHSKPTQCYANSIAFAYTQKVRYLVNQDYIVRGCSEFQNLSPDVGAIVPTKISETVNRTLTLTKRYVPSQPPELNKQHSIGHGSAGIPCPACEEARSRAMQVNISPSLHFREAAEQWRESRKSQLSAGSIENYRQYIKSLNDWFGDLRLEDIHVGHIEEYQEVRSKTAGASRINHELSTLQQILKRAKLWGQIREYYEPMPLPAESVGISLETAEEDHLFNVAKSRSRWKTAYLCAMLTNTITIGPKEIVRVKMGDIYMDRNPPVLLISRGVKNKFRIRTLPLTGDALYAVTNLIEMAHKKGSYLPEHYLLPGRPQKLPPGSSKYQAHYDPLTPMGSYRKAWESLRKEAGKKYPRLLTLRRYDLRHNACTKMLEDPRISDGTVEEMMGHKINSRTKDHYSHIRMQRKLAAVQIINAGHSPQKSEYGKSTVDAITVSSSFEL